MPNIAGGAARYPALHSVPTGDQSSVVEGTWVRLDPSFDVEGSGLPAWQKVIARTLQSRGAVNRDNAGAFSIYARNPLNGEAPWSLVGLSGVAAGFSSSFPWSRLQVLAARPLGRGGGRAPQRRADHFVELSSSAFCPSAGSSPGSECEARSS